MKYFSKEHEWIELIDNEAIIGISDYAQNQLGDIVYVSLTKEIGDNVAKEEDVAEIESVKSVSQIYAPVDGKIIGFNEIFEDESQSGIINKDPYGQGWIFKMSLDDESQLESLMSEEQYHEYIKNL